MTRSINSIKAFVSSEFALKEVIAHREKEKVVAEELKNSLVQLVDRKIDDILCLLETAVRTGEQIPGCRIHNTDNNGERFEISGEEDGIQWKSSIFSNKAMVVLLAISEEVWDDLTEELCPCINHHIDLQEYIRDALDAIWGEEQRISIIIRTPMCDFGNTFDI